MDTHLVEAHALADEVGELLLVYLAEALESSDDGVVAQASDGGLALLVGIAVDGAGVALVPAALAALLLALVSDTE